jgi:bifunctional non-homologous end joining protein LigD
LYSLTATAPGLGQQWPVYDLSMPRKRGGPTFTVEFPTPLPAERSGEHWWVEVDGRELRLSNLDKVFWPEEGYTKGDLLAYYYNVAPHILPYLRGRPLTMKRMPDGVAGPHFYEKEAPPGTPEWVPVCRVEGAGDEGRWGRARHEWINYLMVEDTAALLFVVNLGCVEFHPLHSRCGSIATPDYLFFDLDPFPPATFQDVLAVARLVRVACERLGLRAYPKTSGATGVQVYVPLVPGFTYGQVREFVGRVGHLIRQADPDRVTMDWEVRRRAGRVFIDHTMNRLGANIASVYSVRPEPGAPVSTPLTWDEVEAGEVRPSDFTIVSIWDRLRRGDPFRGVLDDPQDVTEALRAVGVPADLPPEREASSVRVERGGGQDRLRRYRAMRRFDRTPEPAGEESRPTGRTFVVQRHDATRLHYDLRLERDGVLVSWAVPKGLPLEHGVRHLAVQTEDHPFEYADFEGKIPEGQYGAGEVRIWDRGQYDLLEWSDRKVSVRLHGRRYRGLYHLVKTARGERDWLIFLARESAPAAPARPPLFAPMLAAGGYRPFDHEGWWFEPKFDGVRTLLYVEGENVRLLSRTGRDQTATYPELARLYRNVSAVNAVVDGEIVATDERGRASFERLQRRMNLTAPADVERARRRVPVELVAFDLLWLDGEDLTSLPLHERRRRLQEVVTEGRGLRLIYWVPREGRRFFEVARQHGLEGIIAKRADSRYLPGRRSDDWRKVKALRTQDCVVLGATPGQGARRDAFGALLLGAYRDGELVWIGQVGTGFTDAMLRDLDARLRELEVDRPPIPDPDLARVRGARWVRPELVCEVEYLQVTEGGRKLRAPSFKRLRPDKRPEDCVLEPEVA